MTSVDYLQFLSALGWLATLALAALLPGGPPLPGKSHLVWLIAFCAARLVFAAQTLVFPASAESESTFAPGLDWALLAALGSEMLLWEFARRTWNDHAAHPLRPTTHLVAAEVGALVVAVQLALGGASLPAWLVPLQFVASLLPTLLGAGALFFLWRSAARLAPHPHRLALLIAAIGLALCHAVPVSPATAALTAAPPWLAAGGLAATLLALRAARSRGALACAVALLATAFLGPLAVATSLDRMQRTERDDLLARATRAARQFPRALIGRLAAPDTASAVPAVLAGTRDTDPLLHSITLWSLRSDRRWEFNATHFVDTRAASAEEIAQEARAKAFVIPSSADHPFITAHAPLRASNFESPAAWVALEYPDAFWAVQRTTARRSGIALVGLLAGCFAMGFVLTVRQALENAQRLATERAQAADKAKTEFLAFLSHEMRTPLQTILGRTELIRRGAPATARHLDAIATQGAHLLRLVTDLLDLGTIEAGKLKLQSSPFSLRALLASLEETHGPVAAKKNLTLILDLAPALPDALVGDESRLRQILGNLLHNAVKFTVTGEVTLRVARFEISNPQIPDSVSQLSALNPQPHGERLTFAVQDTGPGLPPAAIPQLFTLFTRLDAGTTFTREGTGLGLALVRRLCDLMGGTVTAANRPTGGAAFTVSLAFPRDEPSLTVAIPERPSPNSDLPTPISDQPVPPRRPVLLAEDNTAVREFLTEALNTLGHEVTAVADGESALAAARAHRFTAAVLDINLPLLDGIALARILHAEQPSLRLIGCSAEAAAETSTAALAAGMVVFLAKPIALSELSRALDSAEAGVAALTFPSAAAHSDIFVRLSGPAVAARTQALLAAEWPAYHSAARRSLAARHDQPLTALAHRLQSSALLSQDPQLQALCRELSAATAASDHAASTAALTALDHHLRSSASPS